MLRDIFLPSNLYLSKRKTTLKEETHWGSYLVLNLVEGSQVLNARPFLIIENNSGHWRMSFSTIAAQMYIPCCVPVLRWDKLQSRMKRFQEF